MTRDEDSDDVVRARHGIHSTRVTYGARSAHRSMAEVWQDFVHRYGWRAYALPVLIVLTVAALLSITDVAGRVAGSPSHHRDNAAPPPVASGSMTLKADAPGARSRASRPARRRRGRRRARRRRARRCAPACARSAGMRRPGAGAPSARRGTAGTAGTRPAPRPPATPGDARRTRGSAVR